MTQSETFTTSDGLTVDKTYYGLKVGGHSLGEETTRVLREFFLAERDKELGRWRWPDDPDFVVYPDDDGDVSVVSELLGTEKGYYTRKGVAFDHPRCDSDRAAAAYFAAHPEPKPWEKAEEGSVWELVKSENPAYQPGLWAVVKNGAFVFKSAYGPGFDRIGRKSSWEWKQIYPEVAESSESD